MSGRELGWRLSQKARSVVDRRRVDERRRVSDSRIGLKDDIPLCLPNLNLPLAERERPPATLEQAAAELIARADRITRNQVDLFDLKACDLGPRIDWNFEYKARKRSPLYFAPDVDYRDYRQVGDCKFVWELSRHQHWVVLGRAYRLTGQVEYAQTVLEQFDSWVEQCPYGLGMNWRSPLELAIRVINWAWAFALIRPAGLLDADRQRQIARLVYLHLWDITRNYSRFSSANNHLIGEAAGVFIAATVFDCLGDADRWRKQSRDVLIEQIEAQTYADGGNKEQAMGYHLFVLEFFLLVDLIASRTGSPMPADYRDHLASMLDYAAGWLEGGPLPQYGDADDGYVLDLGGTREHYARELLAVGAVLFGRSDWALLSEEGRQRVWWLFGQEGLSQLSMLGSQTTAIPLRPRAFPQTGYYLLQSGGAGSGDRVSLSFDCGELGFGQIAAHGHADALSVTLRVNGTEVLADPGTYDYFTYRAWRDYFKSTRAHNTVRVDGVDQSEMLGLFLWGRRARSRCRKWAPDADGGLVCGEHDGYQRLARPVTHRRTLSLRGNLITIADELSGPGPHIAEFFLHFGVDCEVSAQPGGEFLVVFPGGSMTMKPDSSMTCRLVRGMESPIGGWSSRAYHGKTPTWTMIAEAKWEGSLRTAIHLQISSANEAEPQSARPVSIHCSCH